MTLLGSQLGYGTYSYHTNSRTDNLDVNVTFGGGFTFDDYGDEQSPDGSSNREIDIGEDSRWGVASDPNTQNVKQPYNYPPANGANRHRFSLPDLSANAALTRIMIWRKESLRFITLKGTYSPVNYPANAIVNDYTYTHDPASGRSVPVPGRERFHFNLWLNKTVNATAPSDGQPVEVIISDFTFTTTADCVFNWAESVYPNLFAPPAAASQTLAPYYYRYYAGTNAYLGISSADNDLYYLGPASGNTLFNAGLLSNWRTTAGCP